MGANIKVGLTSSNFRQQMAEINRQLKLMSSECGVAAEQAAKFGNKSDQLAAKQKELTSKIKTETEAVKLQQDRIKAINGNIDDHKEKMAALKTKIESATKAYAEECQQSGKNSEASKKLKNDVNDLKEEYAKEEKALNSSNKELDNVTIKMNKTKTAIIDNKKALQDTEKQIKQINFDKVSDGFEKIADKSGKVYDTTKKVSAGIIGTGVASIKMSLDFDKSMAKVNSLTNQTGKDAEKMKQGVIDLSNQTGISCNDIAEQVYQAVSAGQDAGDALEFIKQNAILAKTGFTDLSSAVDISSTILNSWGLKSKDLNKTVNTLLITQDKGKTTVDELAQSMGSVSATANMYKINLQQVSAGYAALTKNGIDTNQSGTALTAMFSELGKSGTTVSEILKKKTGKSFAELMGSGKSLTDVLSIIQKEADKNHKSLGDMFSNKNAIKGAATLSNHAKDFSDALTAMNSKSDISKQKLDALQTPGAKFSKSLNEMKNTGIKLGDVMAPTISGIADSVKGLADKASQLSTNQLTTLIKGGLLIVGITGVSKAINTTSTALSNLTTGISKLNTLPDKIQKVKDFGGKLGDAGKKAAQFGKNIGGGVVTGIKTLATHIGNGAKAVGSFTVNTGKATAALIKNGIQLTISAGKWVAHKVAVGASAIATGVMKAAQAGLNVVMSMNPIGLMIIAITSLIAIVTVLYNKCSWFRNGVNSVCSSIGGLFSNMGGNIKNAWNGAISWCSDKWASFKNSSIGQGVSWIANKFGTLIDAISHPFETAFDTAKWIVKKLKGLFDFEWHLPDIELPHFSITGNFSLNPPSIPHVKVQWYAKGGIMTKPTLFGMNGNNAMVGGEAGNEAILPLSQFYDKLKSILDSRIQQPQIFYITTQTILDGEIINENVEKKVTKRISKTQNSRKFAKGSV